MASVPNYHKLKGLDQHTLIFSFSSRGQRSEVSFPGLTVRGGVMGSVTATRFEDYEVDIGWRERDIILPSTNLNQVGTHFHPRLRDEETEA